MNYAVDISELIGKTLKEINVSNDEICFICKDETKYRMCHTRDCCETVTLEDICGDLSDLINIPILLAEEETNSDDNKKHSIDESFTWTFYKLATIKGYVTISWYGESNGYYSESVDLCKEVTE